MTTERQKAKSRRGDGYRRYSARRKVCAFCADKNLVIDYKDPSKLRRFLTDRAKIEPRRKTGTCARHQRKLTTAIKRARLLAMLPFTGDHIRWSGGVGVRPPEERRRARDERRPAAALREVEEGEAAEVLEGDLAEEPADESAPAAANPTGETEP
ncbi:MAG: 30S ribosomal protein S18 [Chloroflexota bacterium]|nr:30S ribosomal protein S18 [Chloroflexota bacterium]